MPVHFRIDSFFTITLWFSPKESGIIKKIRVYQGGNRMKKVYVVISIVALITCLTGIPDLIEEIALRGLTGVNYGRVVFPLLISGISFYLFRKRSK